jgi:hypothetical protein
LFVAHPGHELLVHHWMERERPLVLVLTDGSGSAGLPRLEHARRIVLAAGAEPGPVFGAASDTAVYRAILQRDAALFEPVIETAAQAIIDCGADILVHDPIEERVLVHDLCAALARLAAERATARTGLPIRRFDFPIEVRGAHAAMRPGQQVADLDAAAVDRKRAAALSVPPLTDERERLLRLDPRLIEREVLTPLSPHAPLLPTPAGETEYERHGRERMAQGVFQDVITFDGHLAPLVAALAARGRADRRVGPDAAHAG